MNLMLRKMGVTFLAVAAPILIAGLIQQLDEILAWASGGNDIDLDAMKTALIAVAAGAVAAGARAVLGYFLTIVPTDALHGPGSQKGHNVNVHKDQRGKIVWGP